ncbi:MAG TPA: hypothetical protein VMW10_08545 [Alphaproteobacteria bacterium]|nr:hypothetical protein [Alphaproteobacteria bacterium]
MSQLYKPFITGTAAYGPFNDQESDIDIGMMYDEVPILRASLEKAGFEIIDAKHINPIYEGFSVDIFGRKFQFICLLPGEDYHSWKYATEMMLEWDLEPNKKLRLKRFGNYRNKWSELSYKKQNFYLKKWEGK